MTPPSSPADPKRALLLFGLVPAILAGGAALFPLADLDMGWHIAAGRRILSGSWPSTNTLSWTFPDEPWRFTQWLFGTILALGESLAGTDGIHAVTALFAVAAFTLAAASARREAPRVSAAPYLALLLLAITVSRPRFAPRGDLATLAGLALVHNLCLLRPRRLPLFLFLAAAVWSNLHAGVVFGLLVTGLHFGGKVLEREEGALREGAVNVAAFFAGSLANPHFLYPYVYLLENVAVARSFPFPIAELLPPGLFGNYFFTTLAALCAAAALLAASRGRYARVLLVVAPGALAFSGARFIPFLAILGLPALVSELGERAGALVERVRSKAVAALLALLLLLPPLVFASWELERVPPGLGVDARRLPVSAADYISSRALSGRMFNEFNLGGFLAWKLFPGQRVFVDGRGNAYPWEHFRRLAAISPGSLRSFLDEWRIDFAVLHRRAEEGDLSWGPSFGALGWELVHVDGSSYTFVRPGSADAVRLAPEAFRLVRPWTEPVAPDATVLAFPGEVARELGRIDPATLLPADDFRRLGSCAFLAGDLPLAGRFLDEGRRLHPDDLQIGYQRALLLASSGRRAEAGDEYRRLLSHAPGSPLATLARRDMAVFGISSEK